MSKEDHVIMRVLYIYSPDPDPSQDEEKKVKKFIKKIDKEFILVDISKLFKTKYKFINLRNISINKFKKILKYFQYLIFEIYRLLKNKKQYYNSLRNCI